MSSDLFDLNLAALAEHGYEHLADEMRAIKAPESRLTGKLEDGSLNLDLGHARLYSPDALTYAAKQVDSFKQKPVRHISRRMSLDGKMVHVSHKVMQHVMLEMGTPDMAVLPDEDAGFLISIGVGLGIHLPMLLETYEIKTLVIVEQFREFLYHSLHVVPWHGLFAILDDRGGSIRFLINEDSQTLSNALVFEMRGPAFSMLDGSYIFRHYTSPVLDATVEKLKEVMPVVEGSDGFFEDEYLMLKQGAENFRDFSFHLLKDDRSRPIKEMPVFVIGSGPSLDDCMEPIRRNRENVMVFTGGTGLGPMLRQGIRPDFHCEIENTWDIRDGLEILLKEGLDFSGITLIAANTVHPDVLSFFDNRVIYWRDSVVPSRLYCDWSEPLNLAGPTVTNLAVRSALSMGFFEFYLFGIDLGSKQPDKHHSTSSVYGTAEDEYWKSGSQMEPLTIPVEGNLGSTVYTNRPFLLTRMFFKRLFSMFQMCHFFNCSDGVKLEGATAVIPSTLVAEKGIMPHEDMVKACRSSLPFHEAGDLFQPHLIDEFRVAVTGWFDKADALAAAAPERTIQEVVADFLPMLQPSSYMTKHSVDSAAKGMCTGTMITILQFGYSTARRLPAKDRPRFMKLFAEALADCLHWMRSETMRLTDHFVNETPLQSGHMPFAFRQRDTGGD